MDKNKDKNLEKYYKEWILKISKNKKSPDIRRHIVNHAREVYFKDPLKWSASMRNLIEIFDEVYKVRPSLNLKIKRLRDKYNKDPSKFTAPPDRRFTRPSPSIERPKNRLIGGKVNK